MRGELDKVLHPTDQQRIVTAVRAAEQRTSAEIKVHAEHKSGPDPQKRAAEVWNELGLISTKERNAVLIYVAVHDRRFAFVADKGIGEDPGSAFWKDASDKMTLAFRRGAFGDGIVAAIQSIADRLSKRFPRKADDRDEIDNEISTKRGNK
jgi:uncharacterized membrane protein